MNIYARSLNPCHAYMLSQSYLNAFTFPLNFFGMLEYSTPPILPLWKTLLILTLVLLKPMYPCIFRRL